MADSSNSSGDEDADAAFGGPVHHAPTLNLSPELSGDADADAVTFEPTTTAKGEKKKAPPGWWDKYVGFQESQLAGATGGLAALGGGLSYLGRRAEGGTEEEAQAEKRRTQDTFTYKPRTPEGQRQSAGINEAASYLGEKPGHVAGEALASGARALGASPEVQGAAGAYGEVVGNIPQFVFGDVPLKGAEAARPTLQAAAERAYRGDVNAKAQRAVDAAHANQSMGAAGTAPDISQASTPVKQAIAANAEQGKPLNSTVLQRRLRAERFGVDATEGQVTRDPGIFSNEVNSRGESPALGATLADQPRQLAGALDTMRQEASPSSVQNDNPEHGQTAVDRYKAYDAPIKADVTAKYKALADANGGEMPVDGVSFVDAADAALKKEGKQHYLPNDVRATLNDLRGGGNFSFNDFENLRSDLADASREAERGGQGRAKNAINLVRSALEDLPMGPGTAHLKSLANTARSAAKARFDAIDADPAYEAAVGDKGKKIGEPSDLADTFIDKYILKQPRATIARQQAKFTNDPDFQEAVSGHVLNTLKDKARANYEESTFKQSGFNDHVAKLGGKLDLLLGKEHAAKVRDFGQLAHDLQKFPEGHTVNTSNTEVLSGIRKMGEAAINAKTLGLGSSVLRSVLPDATSNRALHPGAGLDYKPPKGP